MTASRPSLAPINLDTPIGLHRAPNGGWVLYARSERRGEMDQVIGAFSDAQAMINALLDLLVPATPAECELCQDHGFRDWQSLAVDPCPKCRPGDDGMVP